MKIIKMTPMLETEDPETNDRLLHSARLCLQNSFPTIRDAFASKVLFIHTGL